MELVVNMCRKFLPEHIHLLYKNWQSLEATSNYLYIFTSFYINIIPLPATFNIAFKSFHRRKTTPESPESILNS